MPSETSQPEVAGALSAETQAWKELALLSLAAATDHAVHCGNQEVEDFRQLVHESVGRLTTSSEISHVLIAAGSLSQTVEHYNTQVQQQLDQFLRDVQSAVGLFVAHLEQLHPGIETQRALSAIKKSVASGFENFDLSSVPEALSQRLAELAALSESRQSSARDHLTTAQDRIAALEQTTSPANGVTSLDPCTGLPERADAEAALRQAMERNSSAYLAVFYLHRMPLTNARFGAALGNQVIRYCGQHIKTHLVEETDRLFRWSGPAFVALLEQPAYGRNVPADVHRVMTAPMSRFFETATRRVYLPVKMTVELIELEGASFAEVEEAIEHFILIGSGSPSNE